MALRAPRFAPGDGARAFAGLPGEPRERPASLVQRIGRESQGCRRRLRAHVALHRPRPAGLKLCLLLRYGVSPQVAPAYLLARCLAAPRTYPRVLQAPRRHRRAAQWRAQVELFASLPPHRREGASVVRSL